MARANKNETSNQSNDFDAQGTLLAINNDWKLCTWNWTSEVWSVQRPMIGHYYR